MIRHTVAATTFFLLSFAHAQSAVDGARVRSVEIRHTSPPVERECGMSIDSPALRSVSEQTIGFGCTSSYKNGGKAILEMDFQYDPNFDARGGDNITFVVESLGIAEKMSELGDSVLRLAPRSNLPTLSPNSALKNSNCGDPVIKIGVIPIRGTNWHGWIAEETFARAHGRCVPAKEYTSRYRCVHVMIGNEKMTAQLSGVCLLRKRELSLENGFSYDLFMDMLKTISFNEP